MINKKLIAIVILIALLPLVFITGQSSWLILDEVESNIENRYYPVAVSNEQILTYNGEYRDINVDEVSSDYETFDEKLLKITYFDSLDNQKGNERSTKPINAGSYFADTYYDNTLIGTTLLTIRPYPIYIIPNSVTADYGASLDSLNPGYDYYNLMSNGSYERTSLFTNKESGSLDTISFEYEYAYTYKQYDDVGKYDIAIKIKDGTNTNLNYSLSTPEVSGLNIEKKHLSFTWNDLEYVYDGEVHNPSINIENNLPLHSLEPIFSGSVSKNVGTYDVTLQKEYTNYILDGDPSEFNKTIVIKPRSIFTSGASWTSTSFTYDGTALSPIVAADNVIGSDIVEGVYEYYSGAAKLSSCPTDAGSYRVKLVGLKGRDSANYSFIETEVNYTIKKATPKMPRIDPINVNLGSLISDVVLPEGFRLNGYGDTQEFMTPGPMKLKVIYNPDTKNYNDLACEIDVMVKASDKILVSIQMTNSSVEYDGNSHDPSYKIYLDEEEGALPEGAVVTIIYNNGATPKNAGVYTVAGVGIGNLPTGYEFIKDDPNNKFKNKTITITAKDIFMPSLVEIDYDSKVRSFAGISSALKTSIRFKDSNNLDTNVVASDIIIDSMHNGIYGYGNTTKVGLDKTMTNVVGSTYSVTVKTTSNYNLDKNTIIFKYKTAKCGNKLYTIEDAILNASGEINFVGDATNKETYVVTSFTRLTLEEGNPYNDGKKIRNYFETNRNFVVPYGPNCNGSGDNTNRTHDKTGTTDAVYSALVIPSGVELNFFGKAVLSIGAVISSTTVVTQRGVILNEGTINMKNGTKIDCYGYLKGKNGLINLESGAVAVDCMRMFDWPGGSNAFQIYDKLFPLSRWSMHNISCTTNVKSGAEYLACIYIEASIPILGLQKIEKFITVLGKPSASNYLFKALDNNGYVIKETLKADAWKDTDSNAKALYSITGSNQIEGQKDNIIMYGNYTDGAISATVAIVTISTSTTKSMPLSYISVIVKSKSKLTLKNSDYLFLPGTRLTIEEGATVEVAGGVDLAFASRASIKNADSEASPNSFYNKGIDTWDSELVLNGEIKVNGNIGGKITSTEPNAKLNLGGATLKANFQLLNNIKAPIYFNSSVDLSAQLEANGSYKPLTNMIYISQIDGNNVYFVPASNIKEFTINYYDSDGITLINSQKIQLIGEEIYNVTGDEYAATKKHHKFKSWVRKDGSPIGNLTIAAGGSADLKATWDLVTYTITYTAGNGVDEKNDVNYVNAVYENKLESFTIEDFNSNGVLVIPTIATFEDKYFDGWYPGIDKTIGKKSNIITLSQLDQMVELAPDLTTIPLFCDFTDAITVKFVVDYPGTSHSDIKFDDRIISGAENIIMPVIDDYSSDISELYYFDGWYDNEAFDGERYSGEVLLNANTIFYAKWVKKLSITFYTGTELNKELIQSSGVIETASYYYVPGSDTVLACDVPYEKGHTLVGWSNTNVTNGTYQYDIGSITTSTFTTDKVLYASYTVNEYTLTIVNPVQNSIYRSMKALYINGSAVNENDGQTHKIKYGDSIKITMQYSSSHSYYIDIDNADTGQNIISYPARKNQRDETYRFTAAANIKIVGKFIRNKKPDS